ATLQEFTSRYIALQQAQADAAAQAAATPTTNSNKENRDSGHLKKYYHAINHSGKDVAGKQFSSSAEAWNWLTKEYGTLNAHQNYNVAYYAQGGVIGSQPGLLDFIADAINEDHLIAAREGERVLTAAQNEQFEALVKLAPSLLNTYHPLQNLSIPGNFPSDSSPATVPAITIGDIHLHNVNDVNSLSRAIIEHLPGKMMQAIHRH
ncbi:MAG: hypothetical protein ACI4EQ_10840, partial [Lachnospiraceae bacterium]